MSKKHHEIRPHQDFRYVVVSPGGLMNQSIVIAASRAGALGVLDLEYVRDKSKALSALQNVASRVSSGELGVKLDGHAFTFWSKFLAELPNQVRSVILTYSDKKSLVSQVKILRQLGLRVILEVTSLGEARDGEKTCVDCIIAKGNEAGGRIAEETTFILLQRLLRHCSLPIIAHGGIGLHTASACYAAGAAGVVLDWQLVLTRESSLEEEIKTRIAQMDGTESVCIGQTLGQTYRIYTRTNQPVILALQELEFRFTSIKNRTERLNQWHAAIKEHVTKKNSADLLVLGQDVAFASGLSKRFRTVAGSLDAIRRSISSHCEATKRLQPLRKDSAMAKSHGTQYPIVQGPMNRISDMPAFASVVAERGALPFLALGMMTVDEIEPILRETAALLGDRPWGVGLLGFIDDTFLHKQIDLVLKFHPRFSLIAGGRPGQAQALEAAGITSYLHIPSPRLLKLYIEEGSKHFIFEGRECGGHIGPLTSFVLWETCVEVLLEMIPAQAKGEEYHVLFAGGITDAMSSVIVATLASLLAERGVRVGVQLGTSYLFTKEVIETGAICEGFQKAFLKAKETVVLDSGGGHAIRCTDSNFVCTFKDEKRRLHVEGKKIEEKRIALERLSQGRLRIAAKGVAFNLENLKDPNAPMTIPASEQEQKNNGIYMVGQGVALHEKPLTVRELHEDLCLRGSEFVQSLTAPKEAIVYHQKPRSKKVAIVGMSCILPKSKDLKTYWENIINKVNAVGEIPAERWDWRQYYDPDPKKKDKSYSRWGGFFDSIAFEPTEYGLPPNSMKSIEPSQILALEVARSAIRDAGYLDREFDREHASVIFGVGGGLGDLGSLYSLRSLMPLFARDIPADFWKQLPEWTEDSFPGMLLNVISGRIANNFDFGGVNFSVDAACASSLAAIYHAVRELTEGSSNMVIAGGVDTVQNPFSYLCFSKSQALSPTGQVRTFDANADGIIISEGVAAIVLKRLEDAIRDGDRIYAVIEGVGGSSDGRDKSLTAPRPEGQERALQRAYESAGISPATVELIEAHGTGTIAGDRAEATSLNKVFTNASALPKSCAVGSVKSMIGHTKAAAGIAGLVKMALSLHYKVLPPTVGVKSPSPHEVFNKGPLYVNANARPWINSRGPRRAGVSAFGFGGTNFHVVLEEHKEDDMRNASCALENLPSELFCWAGNSVDDLLKAIEPLEQALERGARQNLRDFAYTVNLSAIQQIRGKSSATVRLTIVAESVDDLKDKVRQTRNDLSKNPESIKNTRGVYYSAKPLANEGKVAFLFPGQGSQRPDMLRDLTMLFPEMRQSFCRADKVLIDRLPKRLSDYIFPAPRFTPEEEKICLAELTKTDIAQPALAATEMGLLSILNSFGVAADMVAGHSSGEYAALSAAGVFSQETLYELLHFRGSTILEMESKDLGTMLAVMASPDEIELVIYDMPDVFMANFNSPKQTVLSGSKAVLQEAKSRLEICGIMCQFIPVNCAFHSPFMKPARSRLAQKITAIKFNKPTICLYSNSLAAHYPTDKEEMISCLSDHLTGPVRFKQEVEAMHDDGARIFIEVGPQSVLTKLTKQILSGKKFVAVSCNSNAQQHDVTQLHHVLAELLAEGIDIRFERLFQGREVKKLSLDSLDAHSGSIGPTTWMVAGDRAWPARESRPERKQISLKQFSNVPTESEVISNQQAVQLILPSPANFSSDSSKAEVMMRHQKLMTQFLQQQREVMLTYLHGAAPQSMKTAKPKPMVSKTKTVSSPVSHTGPISPPKPTISVQQKDKHSGSLSKEAIQKMLISLTSERTGYPPEMIGLDLNLEADLGIDSIKRVEILTAFRKSLPNAPADLTENLTAVKSLRDVINHVTEEYIEAVGSSTEPTPSSMQPVSAQQKETSSVSVKREDVEQMLIALTSERTGYPAEMLGLDLNLEADLGIDSIKRVEILTAFRKRLPNAPADLTENLSSVKSLCDIIDQVVDIYNKSAVLPAETIHQKEITVATKDIMSDSKASSPLRCLLSLSQHDLNSNTKVKIPEGVIVITDNGGKYAEAFQTKIQQLGGVAVIARLADSNKQLSEKEFAVRLTNPASVEAFVKQMRSTYTSIGGVVHMLPLRKIQLTEMLNIATWQKYFTEEVKSFFYLLRAAAADLKNGKPKWVIGCTKLGGTCSDKHYPTPTHPWRGGVTGIVKTVMLEWTDAFCKSIDTDDGISSDELVSQLLSEMRSEDGQGEVYYRNSQRWLSKALHAPLKPANGGRIKIHQDDVILVTGGARGITAEVLRALARRFQPTILLAGRSPWPGDESPLTASITAVDSLKKVLIKEMGNGDNKPTPKMVEAALLRIIADREMRATKRALEEFGVKVFYHQVDVRDSLAFAALIDNIYKTYGRLDGVISGAGVIEDKLLEDKASESFDRVFDTKTQSAVILSAHLKPESLKFLVFFSSIAGSFGNRGQSDYSAANEVLNRLAMYLDTRWPGRVVAINWGPWEKIGMANPALQLQFIERGIIPIQPSAGSKALLDELFYGEPGQSLVVVGNGPWVRKG